MSLDGARHPAGLPPPVPSAPTPTGVPWHTLPGVRELFRPGKGALRWGELRPTLLSGGPRGEPLCRGASRHPAALYGCGASRQRDPGAAAGPGSGTQSGA